MPASWNSSMVRLIAGKRLGFSFLLDMKGFKSLSPASYKSALTIRLYTRLKVDPFKACFFELWILWYKIHGAWGQRSKYSSVAKIKVDPVNTGLSRSVVPALSGTSVFMWWLLHMQCTKQPSKPGWDPRAKEMLCSCVFVDALTVCACLRWIFLK